MATVATTTPMLQATVDDNDHANAQTHSMSSPVTQNIAQNAMPGAYVAGKSMFNVGRGKIIGKIIYREEI